MLSETTCSNARIAISLILLRIGYASGCDCGSFHIIILSLSTFWWPPVDLIKSTVTLGDAQNIAVHNAETRTTARRCTAPTPSLAPRIQQMQDSAARHNDINHTSPSGWNQRGRVVRWLLGTGQPRLHAHVRTIPTRRGPEIGCRSGFVGDCNGADRVDLFP